MKLILLNNDNLYLNLSFEGTCGCFCFAGRRWRYGQNNSGRWCYRWDHYEDEAYGTKYHTIELTSPLTL